MDRFSRVCLLLIVVLLAMIAGKQYFTSVPVHAAKTWEYSAVSTADINDFNLGKRLDGTIKLLDKASGAGWEVYAVATNGQSNHDYTFFLRK
jgi:hypothetical protein